MSILKLEKEPAQLRIEAMNSYVKFLETMNDKTVAVSARHFDKAVRYQGPFKDVSGREEIVGVFAERCCHAGGCKFKVHQILWSEDEQTAFLRWDMVTQRGKEAKSTSGMSEVMLTLNGQVASHIDYFDPVPYMLHDMPIVGRMLRKMQRTTT